MVVGLPVPTYPRSDTLAVCTTLLSLLAPLLQVFSPEGLPVGTGLFGGAVHVVPALTADQVPGKKERRYMIHFPTILLSDGQSHLVVSLGCDGHYYDNQNYRIYENALKLCSLTGAGLQAACGRGRARTPGKVS